MEKYTDKIEQQIKESIGEFETKILGITKGLCVESFKNGIEVGKGRKVSQDSDKTDEPKDSKATETK